MLIVVKNKACLVTLFFIQIWRRIWGNFWGLLQKKLFSKTKTIIEGSFKKENHFRSFPWALDIHNLLRGEIEG